MILIPTMRLREVQMNIFRELRKKKGLTQIELAKMVNVQQTTVSKWEVGRAVPDYPVLLKLAELYGVSVDYLLGREAITPEERLFKICHKLRLTAYTGFALAQFYYMQTARVCQYIF